MALPIGVLRGLDLLAWSHAGSGLRFDAEKRLLAQARLSVKLSQAKHAEAGKVLEELGFSPENITKRAKHLLERVRPAAAAGKA